MLIAKASGAGAPLNATFITQTPNASLTNEQALSALGSGILYSTTGTGVVSIEPFITSISALGTAADRMIYTTGVDTAAETDITPFARTILDDANAAAVRNTLGLGTIATINDAPAAVGEAYGRENAAWVRVGGAGAGEYVYIFEYIRYYRWKYFPWGYYSRGLNRCRIDNGWRRYLSIGYVHRG